MQTRPRPPSRRTRKHPFASELFSVLQLRACTYFHVRRGASPKAWSGPRPPRRVAEAFLGNPSAPTGQESERAGGKRRRADVHNRAVPHVAGHYVFSRRSAVECSALRLQRVRRGQSSASPQSKRLSIPRQNLSAAARKHRRSQSRMADRLFPADPELGALLRRARRKDAESSWKGCPESNEGPVWPRWCASVAPSIQGPITHHEVICVSKSEKRKPRTIYTRRSNGPRDTYAKTHT